ncbi:MAG: aldehyde dehydrogenase family protein [Thermoprotei archaeon]
MTIKTANPYSGQVLGEYEEENLSQIEAKILRLRSAQKTWGTNLDARLNELKEVKKRFESNTFRLAEMVSKEMGKPISQSLSEVKKSIWLIDVMSENAHRFLDPEEVKTEAAKSYVRFDPMGVTMLIEPWNYPVWQVMRAAVPALIAGNSVLLKHSSTVSGTSRLLEEIFDLDVFSSIITTGETALSAIKFVDTVSFTGSAQTGSVVAAEAGKQIKKCVLELGGSDPFIVVDGSNLEEAAKVATDSRLQNAGQVCISAKRFLVSRKVYDDFYNLMKENFSKVVIGDPLKTSTYLGPLSSRNQAQTVRSQVNRLRSLGKVEETATGLEGNFVPPTIVQTEHNFEEEVFGPVAILRPFDTNEEAIRLANDTPYGLAASIWGDPKSAEELVPYIEAGMVYINHKVTSDPRLPFGGVKRSGFGRELSRYGLLEFTNIKSVWVDFNRNPKA